MKIDLFSPPDPLWFDEGEDRFALHLRRFDDLDRARIIDALGMGVTALQAAVKPLVVAWQNVNNKDGNPIPFDVYDGQSNQPTGNNLGKFLGAVSMATQLRVVVAIVAFVGLPTESVEGIVNAMPSKAGKVDSRPTEPPANATPPSA